jgi:tetratricopeptide (TPR) repeat protein
VEYRIRLELGAAYQPRLPVPVAVDRDYARYTATYAVAGRVFTATRALTQTGHTLPAARAGDYRSFRRVIAADAEQRLPLDVDTTLTTAADPDMKAADLARSGYDALNAGNFEQALALLTRVVELEPAHKTGWIHLGQAYVGLRRYPEAVAAFKKQLEINPYDEFANNNLAAAYVRLRQYADAEAAFRKQLEANPLDRWTHGALGRMYLETKRYGDAVPELEKAISLNPDNASLQIDLGSAYLSLGRNDEAMAAFTRAGELSATPFTWNNVAYQLSLKGVHLDRAQQYAESAVGAAVASARNFSVEHFSAREIAGVQSLASYWDTLGWVLFAKGDIARAEPLVGASWRLSQSAEVGDHLAQIYEKQGRKDEAIRTYGMALNADRPDADVRARLERLTGSPARADAAVATYRGALDKARTFEVSAREPLTGAADFVLLFGGVPAPEAVAFASGDPGLRPLTDAIKAVSFNLDLPKETPARVLRRATVRCTSGKCTILLQPTTSATPVQ